MTNLNAPAAVRLGVPQGDAEPSRGDIAIGGLNKLFVSATAGEVSALSDVNLTIGSGEFIALLGPSGCGKSTLLRILAGLETATEGHVSVGGRPVTGPSADVALVFQSSVLLPWRSILSNVLLPAELGPGVNPFEARARSLLASVGLAGFEHHRPRELSGGMRQRAAICRALLLDQPILLMDEPFGALDAMTRDTMNEDLHRIWRDTAKTVVFVTHDIAEAVRLATRIVVMSARPGRVLQEIATEFPANLDVSARSESTQFLELSTEIKHLFSRRH